MDLKKVAFELLNLLSIASSLGVSQFALVSQTILSKKYEFIFERHLHIPWGRNKSGFEGYY